MSILRKLFIIPGIKNTLGVFGMYKNKDNEKWHDNFQNIKHLIISGEPGQNGFDSDEGMEEGEGGGDIKDRLLKMTIGLPNMLLGGGDGSTAASPADQLKTISETIGQLTTNLSRVAKPSSIQELSILQATLVSLQQAQLIQFHVLNQLHKEGGGGEESITELANRHGAQANPFIKKLQQEGKENEDKMSSSDLRRERELFPLPSSANIPLIPKMPELLSTPISSHADLPPPPPPTKDLFSSTVITNHEPMSRDQPPVNSLELLQQKAQGILNSASKGVLANNMTDMNHGGSNNSGYSNQGSSRSEEPSIKHRCKYCGKVFGSDSALNIHIRSHTGERPYKCNVCGNRFTTKGNLKVHFQRHGDRFPRVKMNPNMVPEHVDKFYPSLLQQCEEAEKKGLPMPNINNPMAGMNPVVPPGMTLPTNLPGMPPPVTTLPQQQVRVPTFQISQPKMPLTAGALPRYPLPTGALPNYPLPADMLRREEMFSEKPAWLRNLPIMPRPPSIISSASDDCKQEMKDEIVDTPFKIHLPIHPLSKESVSPRIEKELSPAREEENRPVYSESEDGVQDEPENLSSDRSKENKSPLSENKSRFPVGMIPLGFPQFPAMSGPLPLNPLLRPPVSPISSLRASGLFLPQRMDPTRDPNLVNNLLPTPGSTDNSWESLIEVDKSNEMAKLESLVDRTENTVSESNECLICHRVLSCKSALQMHYRTHTGERPFKCKICKRTFTTKGNLKTHMSVHRTKPPMRSFPQCPVCHKKYTNPAILQQHIRTHTGEKTEMSLEQISAAEVRDFPPHGLSPEALGKFLPGFPMMTSPLSMSNYDEDQSGDASRPSSVSSSASAGSNVNSLSPYPTTYPSFSTSLAALERQVKTMDAERRLTEEDQHRLSGEERRLNEDEGPGYGLVRPFSREMSPDSKEDEPEDLSKPNTETNRSDCSSSCDQDEQAVKEDSIKEETRREEDKMPAAVSPPFPHPHLILPGQNPLLLPMSAGGVPNFGQLHAAAAGLPFPPLGFPNHPLAHLASPPGLQHPPPPGFPGLGLPFPSLRRKLILSYVLLTPPPPLLPKKHIFQFIMYNTICNL